MSFVTLTPDACEGLPEVFRETFAASEGAAEGAVLHDLVRDLLRTDPGHLRVFADRLDGRVRAAILFTRLWFGQDPRQVWLLSPVAVRPDAQGQGIGSGLIRFGQKALRGQGADLVVTYGDPAFYGRLGFAPVDGATVPPPHPLSMPQGWQLRHLTDAPFAPLPGPSRCVAGFDRPEVW